MMTNLAYQRLRDTLPPREGRPGAFPTDPRRIRTWVDALPRANQQATLRQMSEALELLRGMPLRGAERLLAMESLRPSLMEGIAQLERVLVGSSFPLPPAKAQVADQIATFHRELALAYRVAVVELCAPDGSAPFLKSAQVALVLERAIYHASRELAGRYLLYRMPTDGSWQLINGLFRLAQALRLEDRASEEPVERSTLSPRQAYAQALLLALSNPYRFSQREQGELWLLARDLSAHIQLRVRRTSQDALAVSMNADRGPGYLPEEREPDGDETLWIDLSALHAALDPALRDEQGGSTRIRFRQGPSVIASTELLRRLRTAWSIAAERGHARLEAGHGMDTVIGLGALHHQLAGGRDFDSFMRDARGVDLSGLERDRAVWAQGSDLGRTLPGRARVLDQSLGGYRLAWSADAGVRARVGELIGLALPAEDDLRRWMIGVIRWLRYGDDGSVDAGVELLARRALAVGLRAIDAKGARRTALRGVQIEGLRAGPSGTVHLIVPTLLDAGAAGLELTRAADPDAFEDAGLTLCECVDLQVLEQAGDYQLMAVRPQASQ